MSFSQPFSFNGGPFQTNGNDILLNAKAQPGVYFIGIEAGATVTDVRHIAGATWITSNALYSSSAGGFTQYNTSVGSVAIVLGPGTSAQLAVASAGSANPISWMFSNINGSTPTPPSNYPPDYYFIDYYNADPTGAALSDAAFTAVLAAIAASTSQHGCIVVGAGSYRISQTVNLPSNVAVLGQGVGVSTITQTTTGASHFAATSANYIGVAGLTLKYSSPSGSGKSLSFTSCTFVYLDSLYMSNWGYALYLNNTSNVYASKINAVGSQYSVDGFYVTASDPIGFDSNEIHLTDCVFGGPTTSQPITGASYHLNGCAAVWMTSCDSFNARDNMLIDPGSGQLVSNLFVSNSSFDYGTRNSISVLPNGGAVILCSFENLWASGGAVDGFHIDSTNGPIDQFQITNLRANNVGTGYGVNIVGKLTTGQTNLTNVSLVNPILICNFTGGVSIANASQITVVGGFNGNSAAYSNPPYTNQQKYAINLTGTNNNISFIGHTYLSTNCLAAFQPGSSMTGVFLKGNPGINVPNQAYTFLQAFGVSAPVSGTFYQNNTGHDLTLYVSGGTVTFITTNSVLTGLTSGAIRVPIQATVAITFAAAPTIGIALD